MMTHHDGVELTLLDQFLKPPVAKFASGHLDGLLMLTSMGLGIEMSDMKGHRELFAKLADESFVAVGLLATQVKIAVSSLARIAQLDEHPEQGH